MSHQNVKLKTSSVPCKQEETAKSNPPSSPLKLRGELKGGYKEANIKTSQWKKIEGGGGKATAVPGLPDESLLSELGELAEFATKANNAVRTGSVEPYKREFTPRTRFDNMRIYYEDPAITKRPEFDLKQNLPSIPSFRSMFRSVQDIDYIKGFYTNRIGLLNDLIAHTKDELEATDDPTIIKARGEFHVLLNKALGKAKRELAAAYAFNAPPKKET